MKIVDAVWEKRNLGVAASEITIEKCDGLDLVNEKLSRIVSEYSVVRLPSEMSSILKVIQSNGYEFIEDMIHVEHDLREVEMSRIQKRLYEKTSYRKMSDQDFAQLQSEIRNGMFDNDRISNDSFFAKGVSSKRYINWTNDLREKGAEFFLITYCDDGAGFVVLDKQDEKTYYSVLGGGYEKYRGTGLGIVQKEPEITRMLGGKRLITSVSSNNVGQLKALIMNGYRPYAIDHILVKHRSE
ncbi:MAG: hypothetical protein J6O50_11225 [Ruminiclostridium sp.]|nr:hypothetical protein [Ruminiclostridium sp.]